MWPIRTTDQKEENVDMVSSQIEHITTTPHGFAKTADILRSVRGMGPVASRTFIVETLELNHITGEQAAALTGFAPIAHNNGAMLGKRAIRWENRTSPSTQQLHENASLSSNHAKNGQHKNFEDTVAGYAFSSAAMMGEKSSALRLAPPTSAPSTSGTAKMSAALLPLTDPP